jgi:DNA uptake protein ComE-like DNA-binding protein
MLLYTTPTGVKTSAPRRGGFVIVAVLMVVTVLSLAAYQYSSLMDAEVMAADRIRKTAESRAAADSAIHYVMGYLADQNAFTGTLNSNPFDNPTSFQGVLVNQGPGPKSTCRFSIITPDYRQDSSVGSLPLVYGLTDESGKLNINALFALDSSGKVLHDALMKLPNMTDDIAWSIVAWVNPDPSSNQGGGAESDYYSTLPNPYQCKNGPLDSIEELLLVKGVTPSLLYGTDKNRNGTLDPGEDDGTGFNVGWSSFLTVYSREQNFDSTGNPRINLNGNDLTQLQNDLTAAVGQDLATFILGYRLFGGTTGGTGGAAGGGAGGQTGTMNQLQQRVQSAISSSTQPKSRISSIFSLVSATVSIQSQATATATIRPSPKGGPGGGGGSTTLSITTSMQFKSPLADKSQQVTLLAQLLDKTTTSSGTEMPAKININTAPKEVLLTLPGLQESDVDAIIAKRPQYTAGDGLDQTYSTIAWLLQDGSIPVTTLQGLERYATAHTQVYRVQAFGYFDDSGPVARVEAVIDLNQGQPRIVYYRDLTDLGRSIDPRTVQAQ